MQVTSGGQRSLQPRETPEIFDAYARHIRGTRLQLSLFSPWPYFEKQTAPFLALAGLQSLRQEVQKELESVVLGASDELYQDCLADLQTSDQVIVEFLRENLHSLKVPFIYQRIFHFQCKIRPEDDVCQLFK